MGKATQISAQYRLLNVERVYKKSIVDISWLILDNGSAATMMEARAWAENKLRF